MFSKSLKSISIHFLPSIIVTLGLGSVLVYEHIQINHLKERLDSVTSDLASTTRVLFVTSQLLTDTVNTFGKETNGLSTTILNAQQSIEAVKTKVGGVEQSVGVIGGTVNNLEKLSKVDPQLLKKYSKVYFLNENYTPLHLVTIPSDYVYSTKRQEQFNQEAWPFLNRMLEEAKKDGANMYVKSAYRSFSEQKALKSSYTVTYGAGTANTFSADQGYSEHQLGTTLDIIATGQGGNLTGFDKTASYAWLLDNAYRYGFVLSYPKGNGYYIYEPWHWRFVGVKLATYLHGAKKNFYDLDQREIDTYLASTFDEQ